MKLPNPTPISGSHLVLFSEMENLQPSVEEWNQVHKQLMEIWNKEFLKNVQRDSEQMRILALKLNKNETTKTNNNSSNEHV